MTSTANNGAPARGPKPLHAIIVGAGVGGLSAALALRQAGHRVTLLESSGFSRELGAGLNIAPYCNGALKQLGLDLEQDATLGGTENTGCNVWPPFAPKPIYIGYQGEAKQWTHRRIMVHRANLHTALREKALAEAGVGTPCVLRLSSRVASVDPELGEVTLTSGESLRGDIVLGADGVHSECRKALEGGRGYVPFDCGISAFRFLVPMQALRDDPVTAELLGPDGTLLAALTAGGIKRLICYPISNNTIMNFVFLHSGNESRTEDESPANLKRLVLQVGADFPAAFQAILEKVEDDGIKLWPILDLPSLPTWVNGKMALLGDAAHPFLPHRAEGASQAIEDAVSLGTLFHFGTPAAAVPERLALYETCRKERASKIQEASRIFSQSQAYQKKKGFDPHAFDNYSFGHDEHDHSLHVLRLYLKAQRPGIRMRAPLSFGPAPGPCQPGNTIHGVQGSRPADFRGLRTVRTIRFASSRTYLQNYFPAPAFAFANPGTRVQASLVATSFRDLAWLGGRGFDRVALHIHGVTYTPADSRGGVVRGAFVPVVFEDSVDSLVAQREERGAPVVGCDIQTTESAASTSVDLSWHGIGLAQLCLDGLSETPAPVVEGPETEDEGLLTFRFVPAVGKPGGKPDAAYAVFEPYPEKAGALGLPRENGVNGHAKKSAADAHCEVETRSEICKNGTKHGNGTPEESSRLRSTQYATGASIKFSTASWQKIPTLHHIIKNLGSIPIHEILEAKVEEFEGGSDEFAAVRRLD